jgi:molybdate transport system substrate-binding protein
MSTRAVGWWKVVMPLMIAFALLLPGPSSAQVNVLISGGFSGPYKQLLPEFEKATGIAVVTGSGASQGSGTQTIAAQLQRGVPADVVILSREGLTELVAAGRIVAGSDVDLARVPLGVGVRAGTPKPDVGTTEAFKRTLLSAKVIAVPGSTSGIYLTTKLFPQLGIADRLTIKVTERGTQSAAIVAAGDADLVVQPVSEIIHVPGVDFAGQIPSELQLVQVFVAAIVKGAKEPDAGRRLIRFLASESASVAIRNGGMDPVAKAH